MDFEAKTSGVYFCYSLEIVDRFLFEENNFRPSIAKLKGKGFDAIGVFLAAGQISQFYSQTAEIGFNPITFGTDFFDSLSEVANSKGRMSGAVFATPGADQNFALRYQKQFGNDYQLAWAANAYDFAILVGKHLGYDGKKLTAEEIMTRIKNVGSFSGASSSISFKDDPLLGAGFDFPIVVKRIEGGKILEIVQ